jgi:1-acyl-sn-glycerol-3-phosphate acyltransferase
MLRLAGITLEVRGRKHINLSVPSVYVSNHASMMDMVCLIAGVSDELAFLYKQDMHSIPVFGWGLRFGRVHFPIHRSNNAIASAELQNVVDGLRKGRSVLVFAEGSRTRNGQIQRFKDGAFYLAMKAHTPIVPITINGTYKVLPSESRCVQPGDVLIIIEKPIVPGSDDFGVARDELKEIVYNRIKNNYVPELAKRGGIGEMEVFPSSG